MSPTLFWQHVGLVCLFGAIVGVEHWWSQRRASGWQRRWLDELQLLKRNWGIVAPTLETVRRDLETLKDRVSKLERG